jgi:hypothetical protein
MHFSPTAGPTAKIVWTAPRNPEYKNPKGPHFTIHVPLDLPRREK